MIKDGNYLYFTDESGNMMCLCENFEVEEVMIDLLSGEQFVKIRIWSHGDTTIIELPRSDLNRSIIPKLMKRGLAVVDSPKCTELILEHLFQTESVAKRTYFHCKLGASIASDETPVYLLHNPIGFPLESEKSKSVYHQPEKTSPKGTLESWLDFMNRCVVDRGNMELALSIGACGPVFYALKECEKITDMPIIMLISKSSCGKTISLRVMASLFGSPEETGGLLHNFNCTENAFYAQMESSKGLTMFFDELTSQTNSWDFSKLLYTLPTGSSKRRCLSTGELDRERNFFSPLIITGERSVLETTDKDMGGLHARVLELRCSWSESIEHAHELEYGVRQSYGVAGPVLIGWILENADKIEQIYDKTFKTLTNQFCHPTNQYSGIMGRKLKVVAGIMTTTSILMTVFSLNFNLKRIEKTLLDACVDQLPEQTPEDEVYEKILELYSQNPHKFPKKPKRKGYNTMPDYSDFGVWGERDEDQLWISEAKLQEVVKENNFGDLKSLKKAWYASGLIKRDNQRHYSTPHKLNGVSIKCVCFILQEEPKCISSSTQDRLQTIKAGSKVRELLEEEEE